MPSWDKSSSGRSHVPEGPHRERAERPHGDRTARWETEGVAVFVRGRDAVWGGTSTFWILRFSFLFSIRYPKKRCVGNRKFEVRVV